MKRAFRSHPLLKALSLALAVVLWLVVRGEERVEMSANVKILVENKPESLAIANEIESAIHIRISGPRTRLNRFEEHDLLPFRINLKDAKAGVSTFRVYEEDFSIPKGTHVTRISPQTIRIQLRPAEERLVKVEPKFDGELEEGFEVAGYEVVPPYIKVRGGHEELASISSLSTEPIRLLKRRKSFEVESRVHSSLAGYEENQRAVAVRVTIREKNVLKVIRDIPVIVSGAPPNATVSPARVSLSIRGPAGKVSEFLDEDLKIFVDAKRFRLGKASVRKIKIRPERPVRQGIEITMDPDSVVLTLGKN